MTTRAKVAVIRTRPDRVLDDYARLLALADAPMHLQAGATTILKDNISWHFPFPAANTTPWQLEGTVRALHEHGYTDLACVQNKTVVTNAFKGTDLNGYWSICEAYDVPVLFNFLDRDMKWVRYEPKAKMHVLNMIYPEGIHIPDYFFGKNVVHLPTVKSHIYTTTTGAMKNAFGGLLNHHRHYTHSWIHETLVDLLAIQKEIHPGMFAVMDGTTAGNGPGPRVMFPEQKDVILASADQVAIDAVAAKMMGYDPKALKYITMAHADGLGVGDPAEIEIVGDTAVAEEDWGFRVGRTLHSTMGWLAWYGPTKRLQKLLFRTPLVHGANLFSEAYHDYYRWPLRDRRVYENWRRQSPWGRLFTTYKRRGTLRGPRFVGVRPGEAAGVSA